MSFHPPVCPLSPLGGHRDLSWQYGRFNCSLLSCIHWLLLGCGIPWICELSPEQSVLDFLNNLEPSDERKPGMLNWLFTMSDQLMFLLSKCDQNIWSADGSIMGLMAPWFSWWQQHFWTSLCWRNFAISSVVFGFKFGCAVLHTHN